MKIALMNKHAIVEDTVGVIVNTSETPNLVTMYSVAEGDRAVYVSFRTIDGEAISFIIGPDLAESLSTKIEQALLDIAIAEKAKA